jgi:mono/diheme cytochrome c family protein
MMPIRQVPVVGDTEIAAAALFVQLVPYGRNHTNPPVLAEPAWDLPQTRATFMQACGDCHSNETTWPWYAGIAPVSWLVQRDVDEGRAKFNVSTWGMGENEGDHAAESVLEGEMPPRVYPITHPQANLDSAAKDAFVRGLTATFGGEGHSDGEKGGG